MAAHAPLARVLPGDLLYRKLRPDQWDPATRVVYPAAFIDRHPRLSIYVARIASPIAILQQFCGFPFAKALAPGRAPQPQDLYDHGHGIAALSAALLFDLGLVVAPEPNGDEI